MVSKKIDIYANDGSAFLILRINHVSTAQEAIKYFESVLACPPDFNVTSIDIKESEAQPQQKD